MNRLRIVAGACMLSELHFQASYITMCDSSTGRITQQHGFGSLPC